MSKRGQEIFVVELVYIIWGNKNFKEINIINDTRYIIVLIEINTSLALSNNHPNLKQRTFTISWVRDRLKGYIQKIWTV